MASRTLDYRIDVDASGGVRGLKQFSSAAKAELRTVDESLADTSTAGETVARVLSDMADTIEAELKGSAQAADALATALGPELAARTDIDKIVADLKKMGLSFEDIEGDADQLAASIKKLDQVGTGQLKPKLDETADAVHKVGTESDQTGSVLANMAGNTAGELADIAGVGGVAGQAIGQLAEYATEGGIGLKSLVNLGGPMAGLALATQAVSTYMAGVKLQKEFDAKRVEQFVEAFKDL